jgi:hypothetical protein
MPFCPRIAAAFSTRRFATKHHGQIHHLDYENICLLPMTDLGRGRVLFSLDERCHGLLYDLQTGGISTLR